MELEIVTLARKRAAGKTGVEKRLDSSLRAPCGHLPPCGCSTASESVGELSCCIRCPFEMCIFDQYDHYGQRNLTYLKSETVGFLRVEGVTSRYIADKLGMSERNVLKLYSIYRKNNGN